MTYAFPGQQVVAFQIISEGEDGWRLMGSRDRSGQYYYPPRSLSPIDQAPCEQVELSAHGTLFCAVQVHLAPVGFEAPYWVAYVDMPEGVRVFGPLLWEGSEAPEPGLRVSYTVDIVRDHPSPVLGPVFNAAPAPGVK
jgi:uncharacterized OB-fold protein